MPRAAKPEQAEVCFRSAHEGAFRRETWATSFVLLWHDQFGTRQMVVQNPGEDLLACLHERTLAQLIELGAKPDDAAPTEFLWNPEDEEP